MKPKEKLQNIISFGSNGRIQKAIFEYDFLIKRLETLNDVHEIRKGEINTMLQELIKSKKDAVQRIRKVKRITKILNVKQREEIEYALEGKDYSLGKIEISLSFSETAVNLGIGSFAGLFSGASTAAGTWALVGTYGAASTGTAINGLSGVAATNAILAWLGGGSLATGGLGMAGGTVVLGGIVIVPMVTIMGLVQHWKANKKILVIKEEGVKVVEFIDEIEGNLLSFDVIEKRSIELFESISKSLEVFEDLYKEVYKKVYPFWIFSRFWKWLKLRFGIKPFDDEELEHIATLGRFTGDVLKIVDTKIL